MHPPGYRCGNSCDARRTHNLASVVRLGQDAAGVHGPCPAAEDCPMPTCTPATGHVPAWDTELQGYAANSVSRTSLFPT